MNRQQAETAQWGREVDKAQSAAHRAGEAYAAARDALDSVSRAFRGTVDDAALRDAAEAADEAYRAWRFAVSWLNELQCPEMGVVLTHHHTGANIVNRCKEAQELFDRASKMPSILIASDHTVECDIDEEGLGGQDGITLTVSKSGTSVELLIIQEHRDTFGLCPSRSVNVLGCSSQCGVRGVDALKELAECVHLVHQYASQILGQERTS